MMLLMHEDTVYEDDTIYARGHYYVNCRFERCTIVLRDGSGGFKGCLFVACVWHLDYVLHDRQQFKALQPLLALMSKSLLSAGPESVDSSEDGITGTEPEDSPAA